MGDSIDIYIWFIDIYTWLTEEIPIILNLNTVQTY